MHSPIRGGSSGGTRKKRGTGALVRRTSGSFPPKGPPSCGQVRPRAGGGGDPCGPGAAVGPGPAVSEVCKFDWSSGFGLHPCPYLPLRLISPSSYGGFTNGHPENAVPLGLGTWHRIRRGSSPPEGTHCVWACGHGNRGTLGAPACGRPGPPGGEQFREPPLVGACTLPAVELPGQALPTDVCQLRSRV